MKKAGLLSIIAMLVLLLSGCPGIFADNSPYNFPNSTWVCEEYDITVYIDADSNGTGTMVIEGQQIAFDYVEYSGVNIGLYEPNTSIWDDFFSCYVLDEEACFERWVANYIEPTHFFVTVKESTYFTVGEVLTFNRAD